MGWYQRRAHGDGFLFGDGCLGCMGSTTMCCLEEEFCCKQGADPLCLYCCAYRIVPVSVLIKGQGQTCCCVGGVAIPPDAEVPCMIGTLGVCVTHLSAFARR